MYQMSKLRQKRNIQPLKLRTDKTGRTGYGFAGVGGGRKPADLRGLDGHDRPLHEGHLDLQRDVVGGGVC